MGADSSRPDVDAVWRERDKYLNMSLSEKRNQYPGQYVARDVIKPWPEYFIDDISSQERHSYGLYPPREDINSKVALWEGNITQLEIESIVNSACRPERGGQVNQKILAEAGDFYRFECLHNGLGSPGEAMLTGGYRLPAKYILNTLAPRDKDDKVLRLCYTSCLDQAKNLNIRTIAFPCIATKKRNGFPIDLATNIALDTVRRWLEMYHAKVDLVIFCIYDTQNITAYRRFMQKYFPIRGYCSTPSTYEPQINVPAMEANPERNEDRNGGSNTTSGGIKDLEDWRDNSCESGDITLRIVRGDAQSLVKQLHAIYSDPRELLKNLEVIFEGEEGMDAGGVSREFFYEALETLSHTVLNDAPLFEGPVDHILPCASRVHIKGGLFLITGRVIAHSALNYGMGFCGLSPAIIYLLSHDIAYDDVEVSSIPVGIEDILDTDLRKLLEVSSADKLSTDDKASLRDYMERCNVGYLRIDDANLGIIQQELMLYELVYRRWPQIEALREGMNSFGLYKFLCDNPTDANIQEVFPSAEDLKVVPHMIRTKLEWYGLKDQSWEWFNKIIEEIQEGKIADVTLNTLLLFWTGEPRMPSSFIAAEVDPEIKLPQASTCFNRLFVPGECASYEEFFNSFTVALQMGAMGFGEA